MSACDNVLNIYPSCFPEVEYIDLGATQIAGIEMRLIIISARIGVFRRVMSRQGCAGTYREARMLTYRYPSVSFDAGSQVRCLCRVRANSESVDSAVPRCDTGLAAVDRASHEVKEPAFHMS